MFYNCSDDAYNEKYEDPTKVSEVSVEKLMTGVFLRSKDFSLAGYYRYFAYDNLFMGKYCQTFGAYTGAGMWNPGFLPYANEAFEKFYRALTDYKLLEKFYNEMTDTEKADNEAYYWAAKVHVLDYFTAVLDVYGDLPWTDACKIALTGDPNDISAHYDKAEDSYKMILNETKTANERFAAMSKPSLFGSQDFINEGDFMKWRRYANSIRLRVALRVSTQGALSADGQAAIKEILGNPSNYPLVETNDQNIQIWNRGTGELNQEGGGGFDWGSCRLASGAMINRMLSKGSYDESKEGSGTWTKGIDDPRLPLLFCMAVPSGKVVNATNGIIPTVYRGTNPTMSVEFQSSLSSGAGFSWVREYGFFWKNKKWDHQLFSAAELWFIKAEAYQRGWVDGDAKAAFKRAVSESIKFYYKYQKNRSDTETSDVSNRQHYVINPEEPTDEEIEAFGEARWEAPINDMFPYKDKIDAIITQKWINLGIIFVREAWNDLRRTGYPSGLVFPTDPGATISNVPLRWRYPDKERTYNKYYNEVADKDTYYTKLFWAK
jgi:hypothetical protein